MNEIFTMVALLAHLVTVSLTPEPTEPPKPTAIVIQETAPIETEPEPTIPDELQAVHTVHDYLIDKGYSEPVTAGIIGNMMAECGGQTLHLQPEVYGGGFYGVCQWGKWWFPEVQGKPLDYQLEYLHNTMDRQFGKRLQSFLQYEDPEDAARAFAVHYERCDPVSYRQRERNARRAYEYFMGGKQ